MGMKVKLEDCKHCDGTGRQPAAEAREQLRNARLKAGISMRRLAAELGISFGYLGDMERGHRTLTLQTVERYIAKLEELKNGAAN